MLTTLVLCALASFQDRGGAREEYEVESVGIEGEAGDWVRATHVRITGSSFVIGRELARIGSERHGSKPARAEAGDRIREQRAFFAARYPV